jgi:basic membrane protein A
MRRTWIAALLGAAAALSIGAGRAQAAEIKPAILFDNGGKFDKSFNEGVWNGAEAFSKATGIKVQDFEPQNDSQREQALRTFAKRGNNPILAVGFSQASSVAAVAKEYPKTHFIIIDAVVDAPNVQSILFREEQGSYLAGVLAAMAATAGKVGFVGGMDIPLIRKFACGYAQGAKSVKPDIQVLENMTGTTGAAWNDPVRGGELAKSQMEQGANVVFAAAGATGLGVYQAATDAGKLAIGVDSDQNYLHPGHMLTSMVKHVDVATEDAFVAAKNGTWKPGILVLGLKEHGVGVAIDKDNSMLITPQMKAKVEQAEAAIIAGKVQVHDYMADNKCPM